jgi:hypothetical protein
MLRWSYFAPYGERAEPAWESVLDGNSPIYQQSKMAAADLLRTRLKLPSVKRQYR